MAKRAAPSLEEIAAEVGRLFGTTEAHARKWLQQRNTMLEALHLVRNKATDLIGELSGGKRRHFKRRARALTRERCETEAGGGSRVNLASEESSLKKTRCPQWSPCKARL